MSSRTKRRAEEPEKKRSKKCVQSHTIPNVGMLNAEHLKFERLNRRPKRDEDEDDFKADDSDNDGVDAGAPHFYLSQLIALILSTDELAALDTSNIISGGRRTRGKRIDYTKVAPIPGDDDDDDDDDEEEVKPKKKSKSTESSGKKAKPPSSSKKPASRKKKVESESEDEDEDAVGEEEEDEEEKTKGKGREAEDEEDDDDDE